MYKTFAKGQFRSIVSIIGKTQAKNINLHLRNMSIDISKIGAWNKELETDLKHQLAATVLKNYNADDALLDKSRLIKQYPRVFNVTVDLDGTPVTNQRSSGRCWLFAATNELRLNVARKLDLKEFELSQAYLFFYDKLEKANYFLDQVIDTYKEDVDSRLVQYLLSAPTQDGGQYSMFMNLVEKYGLLPKDLYGDLPYSTTASAKLNQLLTTKLRGFAEILREELQKGNDISSLRLDMQKSIFQLMTMFLDLPPVKPDEEFVWEYVDKEKKVQTITTTPLKFAKEYATFDVSKPVSLINDPRHPYGELIKIDRLGNVLGGKEVVYLNVDNDTLTSLVLNRLKNNKPVFFGSHTPKFMNKKYGVMDVDLWNYKAIGYDINMSKEARIKYNDSLMTHAMLITGCHVEKNGDKVLRYRVENSWGKDSGKDGLYVMTQKYFEEYSFQIVVDIDELPKELAEKLQSSDKIPIVLPIWDPMGALAD
ncbi:LAFE_0H00760g1_1 [Lachancea fermentati]|uniref:Cysteine proteinase 1, mitochondrial n=1 Tax=Lachancea fermentati TaxID=4955 RepID=A0A1G4MJ26_LACFM|nr:LAFE_0H00760g1_1 [Lachancea fermentati]